MVGLIPPRYTSQLILFSLTLTKILKRRNDYFPGY